MHHHLDRRLEEEEKRGDAYLPRGTMAFTSTSETGMATATTTTDGHFDLPNSYQNSYHLTPASHHLKQ